MTNVHYVAATQLTPEHLPAKREFPSSACVSEPSTTEKDTSVLSLGPGPPPSSIVNVSDSSINAFDFQKMVKNAVVTLLPEDFLAMPLLDTLIEPLIEAKWDECFNEVLSRADDQLQDIVDDHCHAINEQREESLVEVEQMVSDKLSEFNKSMAEIKESVMEHADAVYVDVSERLDGIDGMNGKKIARIEEETERLIQERMKTKREREKLQREREKLRRERRESKRERKESKRERNKLKILRNALRSEGQTFQRAIRESRREGSDEEVGFKPRHGGKESRSR